MEIRNDMMDQAPTDSNRIIQGLWIGPELSIMEQLSILSFLENSHEYYLYVYDDVRNIPDGTVIKDANEILPAARIFRYRNQGSYAGFSNFFRYKLLLDRGGWWVDTDIICLKPFDFPVEHIFATERWDGREITTSGIIKAPRDSQAMRYAWEVCQSKKPNDLLWGETGPALMADVVTRFSLEAYRKPYHSFCPIGCVDWYSVLEPNANLKLDHDSYAIHLWNERWRVAGQDKNASYDSDCLYEQLKRKYLRKQTAQPSM